MQERIIKQLVIVSASAVFAAILQPVQADETAQASNAAKRRGDHPAVVVTRMQGQAGYDYASKFYLHPARLVLESVPPREMGDHPAVMVARTQSAEAAVVVTNESAGEAVVQSAAVGSVESN